MSQKNGQQHCQISGAMTNQEAKKEAAAVKEQAAQQEVTHLTGQNCILGTQVAIADKSNCLSCTLSMLSHAIKPCCLCHHT